MNREQVIDRLLLASAVLCLVALWGFGLTLALPLMFG